MRLFYKLQNIFYSMGLLCLILVSGSSFAGVIKIFPNTVISTSKTYNNVTLDMSEGSFIVKNKATLTINNSVISGTISRHNPVLINVDTGKLVITNTKANLTTVDLPEHPQTQSLHYFIQMALGSLVMNNNTFTIDHPFTAGLLITTSSIATTGFQITNNTFENFHGVLYLISSDNATIKDNLFRKNSYGHIVVIGNHDSIIHNTIMFAGNDHLGNSIDIIDSENITVSNNLLLTPTCHGIYVLNSHNVLIDRNNISGGITYAMNIYTFPETLKSGDGYVLELMNKVPTKKLATNNITITNNFMSQNRYGIAASDMDHLTVRNNYFIQRFESNESRKFWTDNNVLLKNVSNITWVNNLYKEAYSQEPDGDNTKSSHFVVFPQSGGVSL